MRVSRTFHALRSGSPTSASPVKFSRRARKSWVGGKGVPREPRGSPRWLVPSHTGSAHRPALQGLLVLRGLGGLAQQLVVPRTAPHGEPQQLGNSAAQGPLRRPSCHARPAAPALHPQPPHPHAPRALRPLHSTRAPCIRVPRAPCAASTHPAFPRPLRPAPPALSPRSVRPAPLASAHPVRPAPPALSPRPLGPAPGSPLTLSSPTGTVCTGMGLQSASARPGAASGNSPARLAWALSKVRSKSVLRTYTCAGWGERAWGSREVWEEQVLPSEIKGQSAVAEGRGCGSWLS